MPKITYYAIIFRMEKIVSFQVDHTKLRAGIFVSRYDDLPFSLTTTFDLRMKRPYVDEVMSTGSIHCIEHLAATFIRNDPLWGKKTVYFGPMGCRTGFYLIMAGALTVDDIIPLLERCFDFISDFEGEIIGAIKKECGNCYDMNLSEAKIDAAEYYNLLIDLKKANKEYPLSKAKSTELKKTEDKEEVKENKDID